MKRRQVVIDYFVQVAQVVSSRSKDPSTKVGAVITTINGDIEQMISTGYNGYCAGCIDITDETPRERKLKMTCHAEANAIALAARSGAKTFDGTIYIYGLPPCMECAKLIRQAGIKTVIYCAVADRPDWHDDDVTDLFNQGHIKYVKYAGRHNMCMSDFDTAEQICEKLASLRLSGIKARAFKCDGQITAYNQMTRKTVQIDVSNQIEACKDMTLFDLYINHWIANYMEDADDK